MRPLILAALFAGALATTACSSFSGDRREAPSPQPVAAAPLSQTASTTPPPRPRPTRTAAAATVVREEATPTRVPLSDSAPDVYTVVRGDTLWDIAARFLDQPWRWPEIWYVNEQIANPHLIYPGDRIALVYVDGVPQLRLERGAVAQAATRLSPQIRAQSLDQAITAIPYEVIAPFLSRPTILTRDQIRAAPYLLQLKGGHLIGGQGVNAYVRGDGLALGATFNVLHVGDRLRDPENGRVLGREALYVGQAQVQREGDPATVQLTITSREALEGDVLLPVDPDIPLFFYPKAPSQRIQGSIMDVVDGVSLIGQYQIVVLNRGADDGLEQGHVLEVFQKGEKIRDDIRGGPFERVQLPEEYAGRVMVFRVLEQISYALVMSASSEIRVADIVRTPGEPSDRELEAAERLARRNR